MKAPAGYEPVPEATAKKSFDVPSFGSVIMKAGDESEAGKPRLSTAEVRAIFEIKVDGHLYEFTGDSGNAGDYEPSPFRREDRVALTDAQIVTRVVKRLVGNMAWDSSVLRAIRLVGGVGKLKTFVAGRLAALRSGADSE